MGLKKLSLDFYDREDVNTIAKELLGKILRTDFEGIVTSGRVVETEAYVAFTDKASHAYNGRRTSKNEHMYAAPGTAYVYICYGMHQMMNVVTNKKEIPDAILIRAVEPLEGMPAMLSRTGKPALDFTLTKGPGNVGKALGIHKNHSGVLLSQAGISLWDDGYKIEDKIIGQSKRIGVESAGADGLLPYRYYIKGNKYVSGLPAR
ncbi:MAG: DNA-3-methyladenine glycosylase [Ferruginibacter sp.]